MSGVEPGAIGPPPPSGPGRPPPGRGRPGIAATLARLGDGPDLAARLDHAEAQVVELDAAGRDIRRRAQDGLSRLGGLGRDLADRHGALLSATARNERRLSRVAFGKAALVWLWLLLRAALALGILAAAMLVIAALLHSWAPP